MSSVGFHRITVSVDGSANAAHALEVALDLARRYQASLTVVAVAPYVPVYVAPGEPFSPGVIPPSELPRYREIVNAAVQHVQKSGLASVTGVALEGVVVDQILDYLDAHPTDLLVVGSRGLSTTKRIFLGSVSSALVTHASVPVLVVRPGPTKPTG